MPGELITIKKNIIEGWAATGRMIAYKPAICVFYKGQLIKGIIGSESLASCSTPYERLFGFQIDISEIPEEDRTVHQLEKSFRVVIGETGEPVVWRKDVIEAEGSGRIYSVEDIILASRKKLSDNKSVFNQLTYADALVNGMSTHDVLSAFYMDYLGRDADEGGLIAYKMQIESGQMTFDEVRIRMMCSSEFLSYRGERFFGLPGSMFTLPYVWLVSGIEPRRASAEDIDRVLIGNSVMMA